MTEVLVGTKKGLFLLHGEPGREMDVGTRSFPGDVVEYAVRDARTGRYFASVTTGWFGPKMFFTDDPNGEWSEARFAFPEDTGAKLERIWVIKAAEEDGVLYAGVDPGALFKTTDNGENWDLVRGLWDQPTRPEWQPGGGGLALHSICPWPGEPSKLAVGMSAVGVWITEDGGDTWRNGNKGIVPGYQPEDAPEDSLALCIHNMHRAPQQPETIYMQFHGGVYRSDDAGESWANIGKNGLASDFGFPLVIDPHNPDRAFTIPLKADLDRVTPDGKVRVYETTDRGESWSPLTNGLPQENAYLTILRQAFDQDGEDPLGLYFGATSGDLFASGDGGRSWGTAARHLPPVLSVRCAART